LSHLEPGRNSGARRLATSAELGAIGLATTDTSVPIEREMRSSGRIGMNSILRAELVGKLIAAERIHPIRRLTPASFLLIVTFLVGVPNGMGSHGCHETKSAMIYLYCS
jgi:hypothetical protein